MKRTIAIALVVIVAAIVVWQLSSRGGESEALEQYEFGEVERGDIENIISSTGTLSAVGTVEVGTQVSGTVDEVLVDYNESVAEGQVLAVLDTTMLGASVRDAEANLLKAKADLKVAENAHRRNAELFEQGLISEADYDDSEAAVMGARAQHISANAALSRAKTNLGYAVIRSPIDGTVIMRNVEPGQTVAASFSTPTLFVIAEDLAEMEIHALVDESDIGQVKEGQSARFTVDAYLDEQFEGVVRQVWLQPETVQNVVNYTVIVDARNRNGLLYPGMTATIDFLIEERRDVLLVPNAALNVQPTQEMFAEFRANMEKRMASLPDSIRERMSSRAGDGASGGAQTQGGTTGGIPGGFGGSNGAASAGRVWYLDEQGRLSMSPVTKGATDGSKTEVLRSRGLEEGAQVITTVLKGEPADGPPRRRF